MLPRVLQEMLGIDLPIIGGTMMDMATPEFVGAISEAGALGIIASAMYQDEDSFRTAIKRTKEITNKPIGVNINLFPSMKKLDHFRYLDIMREEGVGIVETSGYAPPEDLVSRIEDLDLKWMHKCVGVRYALKADSLGADAVTVVGFENGGATGILNVTTLVLVPRTVDAVSIPVIGGGGVVDGRTLAAMFCLGASAAIVGTRLMLSEECPVHQNVKDRLCEADEMSTDVIMRSVGFAHRVWMNEASTKAAEIEARGGSLDEIYPHVSGSATREMIHHGRLDIGSLSVSQGIGLVNEIKPVAEILGDMMEQAESTLAALGARA